VNVHVLEVIASFSPGAPAVGSRFEVKARFNLGRGAENELVLNEPGLGRRHCRFTSERSKLRVEHLGSNSGTFVNGRRVAAAELVPGDCIEVPGLVLRVGGARPLALEPTDALIRRVEENLGDEGVWNVWADHLLHKGDPLGARIAMGRGADEMEDARALGPLAVAWVEGGLEVEWRHGFIARAVLRSTDLWYSTSWLRSLELLLEHPLAHFLRTLEIDALSYARGADRGALQEIEGLICDSLLRLAAANATPVLEQVRFGPSSQPIWSPRLAQAWRACTEALPRLSGSTGPIWVARAAWLQLLSTPPGVSIVGLDVGAQRALKEEQANLVGRLEHCAFSIDAPEESAAYNVGMRVDRELGLWWVEDIVAASGGYRWEPSLRVNGRERVRHRLRPGDVLEPAPGLLFRFVME
jgi:hypothetical protein